VGLVESIDQDAGMIVLRSRNLVTGAEAMVTVIRVRPEAHGSVVTIWASPRAAPFAAPNFDVIREEYQRRRPLAFGAEAVSSLP